MSKFVQTVHTNFHAKSGLCSSRNERVMLTFAIWRSFCFLKILSKFVQTVHTNFHAKSGVCSSKNGRVIALGTKEDISRWWGRWVRWRSTFSSSDYTVQTLFVRSSKVWTIEYMEGSYKSHRTEKLQSIHIWRESRMKWTLF